jgi:hypothetical protein
VVVAALVYQINGAQQVTALYLAAKTYITYEKAYGSSLLITKLAVLPGNA